MVKTRHKMIYEITHRIDTLSLNTVVSGFMEYTNKLIDLANKEKGLDKETLEAILVLISPFTPHLAQELWSELGHTTNIFDEKWPEYDEDKMKESQIKIPVQINGKTRSIIEVDADSSKEAILEAAKEEVADRITGDIVKEIYVPGKIVNIVVK